MQRLLLSIFLMLMASYSSGARLELVTTVPVVRARQIDFAGDYAWVAQNMDGATLLDIKDPRAPRVVRQFAPEEMQPLFLKTLPEKNLLLSADRFQGLIIYDISKADAPTTVSVTPLPPMTTHLDVAETTDGRQMAILARAGEGVVCIDVTDPVSPEITDRFNIGTDFVRAVAVADGIVYAADSAEGGLKALRLVSPGRFEPLYQVNLFGTCDSLFLKDRMLIAGYTARGFRIFELPDEEAVAKESSPTMRLLSTNLRNRSRARAFADKGDLLVVANDQIGVDLYNVANPALPWLADEHRFTVDPPLAQSCSICRDTVYVAGWEAGLLVFRITDEPTPAEFNLENLNDLQ